MFLNGPTAVTPLAVTTTAVPITALVDGTFRAFTITPTNGVLYIGGLGVTAANGTPIPQGSSCTVTTKSPGAFYVIAASGTVDVRVTLFTGVG